MSDIEKHKAFAQGVAKLMREHEAHGIDIKYRLSSDRAFEEGRVTFYRGRHDDDGKLNVIVTTHIGDFPEVRP